MQNEPFLLGVGLFSRCLLGVGLPTPRRAIHWGTRLSSTFWWFFSVSRCLFLTSSKKEIPIKKGEERERKEKKLAADTETPSFSRINPSKSLCHKLFQILGVYPPTPRRHRENTPDTEKRGGARHA
jgi:hypothetical protein